MQEKSIIKSFSSLKEYVEAEDFRGWDPYDGLNSKFFQSLPVRNIRLARLAWIQLFKLNPINLRKLFLIDKDYNAKGLGLFLNGYCQLYHLHKKGINDFGDISSILENIKYLADLLVKIQTKGNSGACWGYNFDWQNRVFFQPKFTPTVVATSFVSNALFEAYEITKSKEYLSTALSSCDFVTKDLNRSFLSDKHFIFSYSPLDNSKVYNASLLGARLLSQGYHYTKNEEWLKLSKIAINSIMSVQSKEGSWVYGAQKNQQWIDSFHTGFNLECLADYAYYTGDNSFENNFEKGFSFYLDNFFLENGTPKYFNNQIYPIDIHSPAQFLITLIKSKKLHLHSKLTEKVLSYTIHNMQDPKGFFYYQLKRSFSSKIPYMRWAQAWMFYALSHYQLAMTNTPLKKNQRINGKKNNFSIR